MCGPCSDHTEDGLCLQHWCLALTRWKFMDSASKMLNFWYKMPNTLPSPSYCCCCLPSLWRRIKRFTMCLSFCKGSRVLYNKELTWVQLPHQNEIKCSCMVNGYTTFKLHLMPDFMQRNWLKKIIKFCGFGECNFSEDWCFINTHLLACIEAPEWHDTANKTHSLI